MVRLSGILGALSKDFQSDLLQMGTIDLPSRKRRYSGCCESNEGLRLIKRPIQHCTNKRWTAYKRLHSILECVSKSCARHYTQISDSTRSRKRHHSNPTHLGSTRHTLIELDALLTNEDKVEALIDGIRDCTAPLEHVVQAACDSLIQLYDELGNDATLSPFLDELVSKQMRCRRTINYQYSEKPSWKCQSSHDRRYRCRTLVAIMETNAPESVLSQLHDAARTARQIFDVVDEFRRIVPFNRELATGDLTNLDSKSASEETRQLIRELLVGSLSRSQLRIEEQLTQQSDWASTLFDQIEGQILDVINDIRLSMTSGDSEAITSRLRQIAALRYLANDTPFLENVFNNASHWLGNTASNLIGPARLQQWRKELGLTTVGETVLPRPEDFQLDQSSEHIPVVYRRLFSDRALEAGDLLSGREDVFSSALTQLLAPEKNGRSVAIVGPPGVGNEQLSQQSAANSAMLKFEQHGALR